MRLRPVMQTLEKLKQAVDPSELQSKTLSEDAGAQGCACVHLTKKASQILNGLPVSKYIFIAKFSLISKLHHKTRL